ncbi:MAG TPA: tRNA (N(6)-L-threonylcarbamoyladenosine(37)-C(2))-methylthiotransferase MtaB [Bdellovibrionota bacterium]|nr:tRNA (N(6)-L-threonylcarbamoyladenosine(37)-C(2))-methylthiotransferase MtaB [Bdellovibrionota bacterium]
MLDVALEKFPVRVKTYTFGCKVNLADTVRMEQSLVQTGQCQLIRNGDRPDVVLVNTCTVTASTDRQVRQLLRRVHREHPAAKIVVTGCYAEAAPEKLKEFGGVTNLLRITEQASLPAHLGFSLPTYPGEAILEEFSGRTRAFLKMQDGCNSYCSFCILPYVRGRSRSIPLAQLCAQVRQFERKGYREIVITGTHLGAYGRDLSPRTRLPEAIEAISKAAPAVALRVSSLEPTTLTPDFIRLVATRANLRPHFHIPLQSGSDPILRRMNRKYSVDLFARRIRALAGARETISIGTDIIVGFPGETEENFERTIRSMEELPFTYLHVFPYSPRPKTRAMSYEDDVPPAVKKERVRRLRALSRQKQRRFSSLFLGTTQSVLVERKRDRLGRLCGYTPHYVPVRLHGADRLMGHEIEVSLLQLEGDVVRGEISVMREVA